MIWKLSSDRADTSLLPAELLAQCVDWTLRDDIFKLRALSSSENNHNFSSSAPVWDSLGYVLINSAALLLN